MASFIWYLKQLLPFRYISVYKENNDRYLTTWRMWFGYCFDIEDYKLYDA